jgi:hypothetical protein
MDSRLSRGEGIRGWQRAEAGALECARAEGNVGRTHSRFHLRGLQGGLVKVGTVKGVAVAVPGTETPVGSGSVSRADFVRAVADVIMQHGDKFADGAMLGGWYSSDRDTYMVEVTDVIPDRETAISEGKRRNQEGVFDLGTGEYIDTGGTGDA